MEDEREMGMPDPDKKIYVGQLTGMSDTGTSGAVARKNPDPERARIEAVTSQGVSDRCRG